MNKNQIIARGWSNGKLISVNLFFNEDKTIVNEYGDKMMCACTMKTKNHPTPFIFDEGKLYCPECGHELEVVETYESYLKKENNKK